MMGIIWLVGLVVMVPLVIIASIVGELRGGATRTRLDVAEDLEAFADGRDDPRDWDDFVSIGIKDPALDAIRARVAELDTMYPPRDEDARWNPAGVEVVREIARNLREVED